MVKRAPHSRSRVTPDRRPPSDFSFLEAAEVAPPASDQPSAEWDIDDIVLGWSSDPSDAEALFYQSLRQFYQCRQQEHAVGPATKEAVLQGIRALAIHKQNVWAQVQTDYPGAQLFVIGIAPEAVVIDDEHNRFEARAELLLQVPAVSASRQSVMAPLTLPLDIEGSVLGRGGPVIESVTLADTDR